MKPVRYLGPLLLSVFLPTHASAADSYLCTADMATGFSYDGARKKWKSADFRSEKKLVISRSRQKSHAWETREVGDSLPAATCEKDFNEAGNLFCSGVFDLRMNNQTLRFLYVYPIGYWSDGNKAGMSKEGDNTPALIIGKCAPV